MTKALWLDTKGTIELAGHVLKGNKAGQFNDSIIVEVAAEVREDTVEGTIVGAGHRFCVAQGGALAIIEKAALSPAINCLNFLNLCSSLEQRR